MKKPVNIYQNDLFDFLVGDDGDGAQATKEETTKLEEET